VVEDLIAGGYTSDTPAHIIEKATWTEERVIEGTLSDIAEKAQLAGITKTAIIAVGQALGSGPVRSPSKLYDARFTHGYRSGN